MSEKKKKRRMIVLSIVGAFVLALGIFLIVWYCGASYPQFYSLARQEFAIPGLSDGVCPQGLTALPENEQGYDFAMSGYLSKGASRVYLIDGSEEGKGKYITLTDGGVADESHFGGVTCSEEYLYVACGSRVACLPLEQVLAAENGAAIEAEYFEAGLNVAFCVYYEDQLFAGEFYRPGNYETDESHHLETADGSINHALVYVFGAGEGAGGLDTSAPVYAISVRDQVQGLAVFEGGIALSCSYGLPDSTIWVYKNVLSGAAEQTFSVGGKEIPLYMLDSSNHIGTLTAPCMSEEIAVRGDRLYILFESKSNKYKLFTRTRMSNVQSVALADLLALS
ncbi:MAG TPA: hypothetical protein H9729_07330 [Candidatus Borkfalkia excrementigallinarum]|uniref:Uncharacterized protein n=1 Tax=Candidatus Borkfalkia excrementigallinarum TaxID=2838506 RepID=A0A9D2CRV8_9FIRM|nr:hypothetical protein [Candidatus Borkfalkia excrementigallinarum]